MPHFTPTQEKILDILSDGDRHTKHELFECLHDELGLIDNVFIHISNIRNKLRPIGEYIVCEVDRGRNYYRHVRLINKSE